MDRPPSRKGFHDSPPSPPTPRRRIRKSISGPLRTEQSSSSALTRPRRVSESSADLSPTLSSASASSRPKGPRGPVRPSRHWSHAVSSARDSPMGLDSGSASLADSSGMDGRSAEVEVEGENASGVFDDAPLPLSPRAEPPASPRMMSALLPSLEDEEKERHPPRPATPTPRSRSAHRASTPGLLPSPLEAGQFDDAEDEDEGQSPSTPPLRIRIPRLASPRPPSSPPLRGGCLSPQARRGWQGSSPLLSPLPLCSLSSRLGRAPGTDVIEILINHLSRLSRPPFPSGRVAASEARASLASLLPLSYHTFDLALGGLYSHLVFTARSTPSLLRILVPPLPTPRRDGAVNETQQQDQAAIDRLKQVRYGVFRIHLDSLAFAPQAAWLRPPVSRQPDQDPLTIAHSVSIGREACLSLGQSTLLATAVARLALPLSLCIDLGPSCTAATAEGRLTALALGMSILPLWPQLATVTLHNAHTLLVKSLGRPALFRPGVKYRLAFGPCCDTSCECTKTCWDDMIATLRDVFALSELAGVDGVQVVLPFNGFGSLMPPPRLTASRAASGLGHRKPVPPLTVQRLTKTTSGASGGSGSRMVSGSPAPSPLRPTTVLPPTRAPGGLVRKVTPKSIKPRASTGSLQLQAADLSSVPAASHTFRDAKATIDLPALARRHVLRGRSMPIDVQFVAVETLAATAGESCTICNYPWVA